MRGDCLGARKKSGLTSVCLCDVLTLRSDNPKNNQRNKIMTINNEKPAASDLSVSAGSDPIVQVSGFGVENTMQTQCNFLLVGLTKSGKVVLSTGDGIWSDVSPKPNQNSQD